MSTTESKASGPARPLSPHLQIYRFSWTMAMSIAHRITGAALYGGTLLVAIWLVAAASGKASYDTVQWFFGSFLGLLVLFGFTFALWHHTLGGIRHLIWDTGKGFELQSRMAMAKFTLIGSAVLTVLTWIVALVVR
ncbi:succinate dehydrogenase, cytochrome b556 subunit [Prosthecomicrobium hirschii]|uniref:Succinate dehydrogenase cytochrome b556 subunit n=1 Tax=Prosthecodimorpha hirschii TaxID=665126 RepID=A0A0N8GF99_9HYPH|nr:succinate dehydrogenase, cytochrome b556 subunit [Prosthecomicrobium hirschii]KPL53729.1 succinate dehydrogenase [Prosthecomicrobium hirschii]MCW1842850.1 succinate dehydrogenase, cytochrome b556 subunit [Prosthecomicrobium hirschii]TPQ48843.1 succinate dehydrogenase, cytochrome b556 subunit [Prosthecomicrobium hirschii]